MIRRPVALIPFLCSACCLVQAQQQLTIDLTGLRFRNATDQSRTSAPSSILPALGYEYHVHAMVKGDSGLLQILYPNPVGLAVVLETLSPGASRALDGEVYNAPATHPVGVLGQRFEGGTAILGVNVFVGATVSAGIRADNIAFFSFTNVVINPSILVGSMTVTSGSTAIKRMNVVTGDMNWDGSVNQLDIQGFVDALVSPDLYVDLFGHDRLFTGDCNRDGTMNQLDITGFVNALIH